MKQAFTLLTLLLLINNIASATTKYWVGPINGNWQNSQNWSLTNNGPGGAGVPGSLDNLQINKTASIIMDVSPVVKSIILDQITAHVVLIAKVPVTITILDSLHIAPDGYLKDSAVNNIPFDVYFMPGAIATIMGNWSFVGRIPVTGSGGASFIAPPGTLVNVEDNPFALNPASIVCMKNSKPIVSTDATLKFNYYTYFITDSVMNATIPFATWAKDSVSAPMSYIGTLGAAASTIQISNNLQSITYLGNIIKYGRVIINLPNLQDDINLAIPDGSHILGDFLVLNTNFKTMVMLAATSPTANVLVEIGTHEAGQGFGGNLVISGNSKVALALATIDAPGTNYTLVVDKSFKQSGGNFSLQNYSQATGASILDIRDDLIETGGSFLTKSTAVSPTTIFKVIMDDPYPHSGPSNYFASERTIQLSSGTIDNGTKSVVLTVNHTVYSVLLYETTLNGVTVKSPLTVGRLELVKGPLTTTTTNIVTVLDPNPGAVTVGSDNSYVNGPLRRATNSMSAYCFPTGKGNSTKSGYKFDSCLVTPISSRASMYQAEYFRKAYFTLTRSLPLQGIDTSKYWNIGRISGVSGRVSLILSEAIIGSWFPKGIVVTNYLSPAWLAANGNMITPGTSTSGTVTSSVTSDFGPYTFGYGDPVALVKSLANDKNVETNFSANTKSGINMDDTTPAPAVYPNPFGDNFNMDFYNNGHTTSNATINIYDLKGSLVFSQKLGNVPTGKNTVRVTVSGRNMTPANYIGQLTINGIVTNTVKLLKAY